MTALASLQKKAPVHFGAPGHVDRNEGELESGWGSPELLNGKYAPSGVEKAEEVHPISGERRPTAMPAAGDCHCIFGACPVE
ncbi:hypothetical protein QTI66_00810 [Variovorax sp. J22R133]|uniref:hypothetical protein n=1 Tax=Variovorax brevis TaxID=3053503 RepID=UPI002577377A|nr:hypothetical protein [Variovorax sp. J22R133]MDM0110665.1 hypothetical protein [Variovorax sp. J22R133]